MAVRSNLVNLDAMIAREDFAASNDDAASFENVGTISLRDFTTGGLIGPSLRKPDFQRETNHWLPEQVVSLLECFVNGDLIPSVILWQSPTFLFVIDGGHRLSALRPGWKMTTATAPFRRHFSAMRFPTIKSGQRRKRGLLSRSRLELGSTIKRASQIKHLMRLRGESSQP